jgi:anti-sigma factor RsiW
VRCAESLRVQAYFDAQLDPLAADQIERHLEHCAECRALLQDLQEVRAKLRELEFERTPAALKARIYAALDREILETPSAAQLQPAPSLQRPPGPQRPSDLERARSLRRARPYWVGALGGFGGAAAAAMLALFILIPARPDPMLDDLVNAHVRSLMPDHLIDVVSSERHTVKPWFAGHADVSPVVADFESQGYKLVGGRADYFDRQRAAVVVYQHGAHTINVFSWASDKSPAVQSATRNGYHLEFWKIGNLEYCAVSDTGWEELHGLVRLLKELGKGE